MIFLSIKLKAVDWKELNLNKGRVYKTATDKAKASTPPNLLGIERKIA